MYTYVPLPLETIEAQSFILILLWIFSVRIPTLVRIGAYFFVTERDQTVGILR